MTHTCNSILFWQVEADGSALETILTYIKLRPAYAILRLSTNQTATKFLKLVVVVNTGHLSTWEGTAERLERSFKAI